MSKHTKCNCVPDLGPPHCHACSDAAGKEVSWEDCPNARVATWADYFECPYCGFKDIDIQEYGSELEEIGTSHCGMCEFEFKWERSVVFYLDTKEL